jgi:hypothetical protein
MPEGFLHRRRARTILLEDLRSLSWSRLGVGREVMEELRSLHLILFPEGSPVDQVINTI